MYHQFNIQQLYAQPTRYLCVLYFSVNKQRFVPLTALTDWFYNGDLTLCSLVVTICTTSLTFNIFTLCPHCIYLFCIYLYTNRDLCLLQVN